MGAEARTLHVEGPAALELVDGLLDGLDRLWPAGTRATDEDRMLFTLAISEVTTNIVQHTSGSAVTTISVDVTVLPDAVHADIRDDAVPAAIEWHAITMPGADSERGRGLPLAQAALDVFEHRYDGQRNVWTLRREFRAER